jgi:GTP cyclohydrolase I
MENKKVNDRTFALFMWVNLFIQSEAWSWAVKGCLNQKMKMLHNEMQKSATRFAKEIEKIFNEDQERENLEETAEVFSKCLELIMKAPKDKKYDLYLGMKQYVEENENVPV